MCAGREQTKTGAGRMEVPGDKGGADDDDGPGDEKASSKQVGR